MSRIEIGQSVRALAIAVVLAIGASAHADVVYLKDGTVLYGRVIRTQEKTPEGIPVPSADGVFGVYDGTRAVFFSRFQIDPTRGTDGTDTTDIYAGMLKLQRKPPTGAPHQKAPRGVITGDLNFDEKGYRKLKILMGGGEWMYVPQMLTYLSPYQVRVYSTEHMWTQNYLTAEFDRGFVKSLAVNFSTIKNEKDPIERHMHLFRFMLEAKWYEEAGKQLDELEKTIPTAKERVQKAREQLKEKVHEALFDFATRAFNAGQLRVSQSFLEQISRTNVEPSLNVKVTTLRVKVENLTKQYELAMRFLRRLPDEALGRHAELLCEAAAAIRDELNVDGLDRLQPFIDLAAQAENAKANGREPLDKAEQLLARAVSGWLLGKESSDAKPDVAAKLWNARRFVAEYIRTPVPANRASLLDRYQKANPIEIQELSRIIALLPPPEPADELPAADIFKAQDRKTNLPNTSHVSTEYKVLLPPEYKPGRPYPVLVALHHDKQSLNQIIDLYKYEAIRNGYILVAPEWSTGFGGPYAYSPEEHHRVLDVLRDLKLHYHVDSDRVFLSGYAEGANAAWDIGLSHPDLFAGVAPISSAPMGWLLMRYWPNAQHLPFYVVSGEIGSGDKMRFMMKVMEYWIGKSYPCLHVLYQGRGAEWFSAELPLIFDWMNRRKRAHPFPELGRWPTDENTALKTMRETDNHFYWMTADTIRETNLHNGTTAPTNAARLQAAIFPPSAARAENTIEVSSFGLKQLTLWIGPGMIDFTKPIAVKSGGYRVNPKAYTGPKMLKPDLTTMMEDFLERGDNMRLFVAKMIVTP